MKIFLTGASRGIGRALAAELIREGHQVWGVARGQTELLELQMSLGAEKFRFTTCDITKETDVDRAINDMKNANFKPEAAILNAGIFEEDTAPHFSNSIASKTMRVNLEGALIWVDRLLPLFLTHKGGQFIAMSSITAFRPDARSAGYSASKAALTMAFRALRLRYQDDGVAFKTAHLGPVATSILTRSEGSDENRQCALVTRPEAVARFIGKILHRNCGTFFFPFFPTLLFRLSLILPDRIFHRLTSGLRR